MRYVGSKRAQVSNNINGGCELCQEKQSVYLYHSIYLKNQCHTKKAAEKAQLKHTGLM